MQFDDFWRELKRLRQARELPAASLVAWRRAPSTHRTAKRLIEEYSSEEVTPPRIDIIAYEQSAGHGREGRPWSSPPAAGVYASLVRSIEADLLPSLPLLVPVTLAETLAAETAGRCRIKWPNDLLVDGAKLGGILIDTSAKGARRSAVISFGVNLAADLEVFAEPGATSLGALGSERHSPASLFEELVSALDRVLDRALDGTLDGSEELIERYRELSAHAAGERLGWRREGETLEGTFRGFDEHGRLRLEVDGAVEVLSAGSLFAGDFEASADVDPDEADAAP